MAAELKRTPAEEALLSTLPAGEVRDALAAHGLPHRRVEEWRWSDIRAAVKEAKAPSQAYSSPAPKALDLPRDAVVVTIRNGEAEPPSSLPAGVSIAHDEAAPAVLDGRLLATLATAVPPLRVEIADRREVTLVLDRQSDGTGTHADRVQIVVGAHARLRLIERHAVAEAPFVNSLTEIEVGEEARVERLILQPANDQAVIVGSSLVTLGEQSRLDQLTLSSGAALARHEIHLRYAGVAAARIDGLYRLDDRRHADFTLRVDHDAEDCETRCLVKGIAKGRSRGVFQGLFHVPRSGQRTDAQMAHNALVLSPDATVQAKPELKIYADDVECAHGNTVGMLDADALFYLRQRGLSAGEAQEILTNAFVAEVYERIADEDLRKIATDFFGGEGS